MMILDSVKNDNASIGPCARVISGQWKHKGGVNGDTL